MSTIFVTGGAGFIGSHTSLLLLEKGYKLVILDSLINSSEISLQRVSEIVFNSSYTNKIKFIKGDIRDKDLLENIFKESQMNDNKFEGVIHFAGLKSVGESVRCPLEYWDSNVNGSLTLFRVMDNYNCRTIVFSSSATIYEKNENNHTLTEQSKINPTNPYGETKLAIEKILFNIFKGSTSKWRIANLRYFNPIGAHKSGLIGENPLGIPNNIFPFLTQVGLKKIDHLEVFGNDWDTPDGTGVRDYIHVMDLAEGHIAALDYLLKADKQNINLNLGTGIGTSVFQLINTFKKVNKLNLPFKVVGRREGDIGYVVANNSFAKSLLNWKPSLNLEDMCRDGWNWQKNNPNGFK